MSLVRAATTVPSEVQYHLKICLFIINPVNVVCSVVSFIVSEVLGEPSRIVGFKAMIQWQTDPPPICINACPFHVIIDPFITLSRSVGSVRGWHRLFMGAAAHQEGLIYFLYWLQYKTLAPVGERVLVKVDVSEEKSVGGILLPSSAQKKPTQGQVEKAGTAKAVKVPLLGKSGHI